MNTRPSSTHFLPIGRRQGYTLVEILVALTLTLILMSAVVTVFGGVGTGISKSRRALEQFDRQRTAAQQLLSDLNGVTAQRLDGRPGRPEESFGYFELVEGSYYFAANLPAIDDVTNNPDLTVSERGDILLFTSRNAARPFVGRYGYNGSTALTAQSDVAEVAWFLRGNRLHRRVLLVLPGAAATVANYAKASFYNDYDVSAHLTTNSNGATVIVPNSLADLTKRENRFGHDASKFPYDVRGWGSNCLPTLAECSSTTWMGGWQTGTTPAPSSGYTGNVDMWDNTPNSTINTPNSTVNNPGLSDQALNSALDGARVADDVVLTNVIGFDVKVWEPAANGGAGGYVDLGSTEAGAQGGAVALTSFLPPKNAGYYRFNNGGITESGLSGTGSQPRIYDSGTFSYFNELAGGLLTNGFDDDNSLVVDDLSEAIVTGGSPPPGVSGNAPGIAPYPVPLRGIQIKIRCFEPDSRQVKEITIEHDFLK